MICNLTDSLNYIDLSKPVEDSFLTSIYPFGFVVHSYVTKYVCKMPDRCEYLLTRLVDPKPLQDFLANWQTTHPELAI